MSTRSDGTPLADSAASPDAPPHASPNPATPAAAPRIVELPGIAVHVDAGIVELEAEVCLDAGWLEQIACSPGTREHESLVVVRARPSDVHAALLLAGFEPGRPGFWSYEDGSYRFEPPTGEHLTILVQIDAEGAGPARPISDWIVDHRDAEPFPEEPWVFGGSATVPNPDWMGPGEHYVADMTGSVIGLVTFGDEVIGFSEVIADEAAVQAPQWVVDQVQIPPIGTPVRLIIRRREAS